MVRAWPSCASLESDWTAEAKPVVWTALFNMAAGFRKAILRRGFYFMEEGESSTSTCTKRRAASSFSPITYYKMAKACGVTTFYASSYYVEMRIGIVMARKGRLHRT